MSNQAKVNILYIVSLVVMVVVFAFNYQRIPPQIPIYYSTLEGDEQIGEYYMIFMLPLISYFFVYINNFISKKFFPDNAFVEKLVFYTNCSSIIIISFIFLRIVFLVI
jgi:hypothetical protein